MDFNEYTLARILCRTSCELNALTLVHWANMIRDAAFDVGTKILRMRYVNFYIQKWCQIGDLRIADSLKIRCGCEHQRPNLTENFCGHGSNIHTRGATPAWGHKLLQLARFRFQVTCTVITASTIPRTTPWRARSAPIKRRRDVLTKTTPSHTKRPIRTFTSVQLVRTRVSRHQICEFTEERTMQIEKPRGSKLPPSARERRLLMRRRARLGTRSALVVNSSHVIYVTLRSCV